MTLTTCHAADSALYLKNWSQKTIDGRSRNAIMAVALKLSGKPRIIDRLSSKSVKYY